MCDFSQDDTDDDFDWIRASGSTPTAGTGPQVDHTLTNTNGKLNSFSQNNPY